MMMDNVHSPLCLQAASESGLPFIVGVTCRVEDGKSYLRDSDKVLVKDVLNDWIKLPNCIGTSVMHQPFETTIDTLKTVRECTPDDMMMAVYPNLGWWISPNWHFLDWNTDLLVEWFDKFIKIGANVIGGCCGMGPEMMKGIYDH